MVRLYKEQFGRGPTGGIDTWVDGLSMETFVLYPLDDGPPGVPRADLAEA